MIVTAEEQEVTPRKKPENIDVSIPCAQECAEVAARLGIPVRAVRDVVAAFATDACERKVVGQVARIYKAHVDGLLPSSPAKAEAVAP